MSKKDATAKILEIDDRGRITVPKSLREGISSFSLQLLKDGSIKLVPQKSVSLQEAELLESLSRSITQFKKGKTKPLPKEWIED